jgi:hypothetical protein
MGLIGDLFPGITVLRKRDMMLEEKIQKVMADMRLQPDNMFPEGEVKFVLKVVQLHELLAVRHSVFVLGPSGSGALSFAVSPLAAQWSDGLVQARLPCGRRWHAPGAKWAERPRIRT